MKFSIKKVNVNKIDSFKKAFLFSGKSIKWGSFFQIQYENSVSIHGMHKTVHNQCELFNTISYFKKVILILCCIAILHYIINDLIFQQGKVVKN